MAYVNVAEWTPEHVSEWLKGLEYSLLPYVHFFLNNQIDGNQLLNLSADDLEELYIFKVGHQQLILEAVELLRQLHYNLTSETLQSLAVKLGCRARSLYNDLKLNGPQDHVQHIQQERVSMDVLSAVSEVLTCVKSLVSWLDRLPFQRDPSCIKLKKIVLKLSIELALTTQRDQFAERPHALIKRNSLHLAELCDKFIQDSKDSLILQPASLDIALIKKKPDEELGIHIKSTYSGVHIIGGIKDQSPAKKCNKIEKGDEIIQVNYQTVIGWQQKKLVSAMTEHSSELHLTIKKRPRHINILGEVIILRPYRIPSKKTINKCHKWSEDNQLQDTCSTSNESECMRDDFNEDEDDSAFLPSDAAANALLAKEIPLNRRLLPGTSPAAVQRRATVSGASPTVSKPPVNIEDLVNGVPRIKYSETFGRSISHDPACHKLSVKPDIDISDDVKSDSETTKNLYDDETIQENKKNADINIEVLSDLGSSSETSSHNHSGESHQDEESELSVMQVLPVQDEESTVLQTENISKEDDANVVEDKNQCDVSKYENDNQESKSFELPSADSSSSCAESSASSQSDDALVNCIILCNSEGIDTAFCGRRPSAHDISNEVAGSNSSDINPEYLKTQNIDDAVVNCIILCNSDGIDTAFCGRRPSAHDISNEVAGSNSSDINPAVLTKVSKLPTSPPNQEVSPKEQNEMSSYQIVIVGGVPQRCPPLVKDGKERSFQYRKKENVVRIGNRRISCKDLGKGDCEGYLYKQKERNRFFPSSHHWVKRWIVLKNHFLYIYRDSNASKAECLISLPGSQVSRAFECKSKKYAFKVSQQHAKFYFATKSHEDSVKWLNKMGLAAIAYDASGDVTTSGFMKPDVLGVADNFYSETDDSESGSPPTSRRSENVVELSTSSSSSELSYDHYIKSDKRVKVLKSSSIKNTPGVLAYPKLKKQNVNDKDISLERMKHKVQNNAGTRQNVSCGPRSTSSEAHHLSPSNFVEANKVPYNRSFSYTEPSYCHFKTDPKNLIRKMSYEGSGNQQVSSYNVTNNNTRYQNQSWKSVEEEYDMLTSSLGRQQKPFAKEITPGLVARMAVSYSNLTQKNASTPSNHEKKNNHRKGIPAPGYVAKISDSFDHLAKTGTSNTILPSNSKERKYKPASSGFGEANSNMQHASCKRSASESQVSKRTISYSLKTESLNTTFPCESSVIVMKRDAKEQGERYVSLLDKEYNKVFEGKKVSQYHLKSHKKSNFSQNSSSRSEMRFFPTSEVSEMTAKSICLKSNSMHAGGDISKCSSESVRNTFFRACCDNPDKIPKIPSELKKVQSFDLHNAKNVNSSLYSAQMYYSHIDSSEGIENIGFSCVDQLSNDSFDSNMSNSSKDNETEQKNSHLSLDTSSSQVPSNTLAVSGDSSDICSPKSASFKFFNSPKFMKKLTSPKLDKRNIFKSKKQAKEKKAEQKEIANIQNDKKFFGSPRLVRAIFGSPKSQKKVTVSSAVQTDKISLSELTSDAKMSAHDLNQNNSFMTALDFSENLSSYMESQEPETPISKSSSNSSLNSNISSSLSPYTSSLYYVEARIKPQITISLPVVADKENDNQTSPPGTPRTPLKPTMGVAMLSKKRLPSISGESSVSVSSSKSSHDGSIKEASSQHSEVFMDINAGDKEMLEALESLKKVDISSDTSDLSMNLSKQTSP